MLMAGDRMLIISTDQFLGTADQAVLLHQMMQVEELVKL
jgi:hypothetical protein